MKKKLLIVVDYQKDFVDGSLGFPGAVAIDEAIGEKIREYRSYGEGGQIIFTMDTHQEDYLNTQEGKNLPVAHCVEGSEGWQLYGKAAELKTDEDLEFKKPTFGSAELGEYLKARCNEYESVELAGVVTNICVISNMVIAKASMPEVPVKVDARCVAGFDAEKSEAALAVMETLQVQVVR